MQNLKAAVSSLVVEGLIQSQKEKKNIQREKGQHVYKAKDILKKSLSELLSLKLDATSGVLLCWRSKPRNYGNSTPHLFPPIKRHTILGKKHYFLIH